MRRILAPLALAGTLVLAGCQNPDGSTDWGSTLALGAGAGLAAGLIAGSLSDNDDRRYHRRSHGYGRGYGRPGYGHGRHGYHGRRW